jgi:predicted Zn-dependent peptidase
MANQSRTYKQISSSGNVYNMLALPGTNYFKFQILNKMGSHIERLYNEKNKKNVYGIAHFIEHLGFRNPKDYSTPELMSILKNEGNYNASTDYDRIDYWFETSMDKAPLAVKLVCNYALNNLDKIDTKEYDIEKKVVYNESKRYQDDPQTMFWFNTGTVLSDYNAEDNVIGIPETIDTFTIDDCIKIKNNFLKSGTNTYNVTYDPAVKSAAEIIDIIESELERHQPLDMGDVIGQDEYMSVVTPPKNGEFELKSTTDQEMTYLSFDVVKNKMTADYGNSYLARYAEDTSLDDVIREQNGLTYGVSMISSIDGYKYYTGFGCDVSAGTRGQMLELFEESVSASMDNWNEDTHAKLLKANTLKRVMALMDQKVHMAWHTLATWSPEVIDDLHDVLEENLDLAYDKLDEKYCSYDKVSEYLIDFKEKVDAGEYGKVIG